jgi:phosphoribosylamine---glycine ligase
MRILVIGTGAREHSICKAIHNDAELYSIMSNKNPGITRIAKYKILNENDIENVKEYAIKNKIEMAIIGPESPLEKGIVNHLQSAGIACIGPTQEAARIETDKAFMRNLFEDYNIQGSLIYKVFDNYADTSDFIDEINEDFVIKPIGLTGGKGVKILGEHLNDLEEAKEYAKAIIDNKISGHDKVVIEERVFGEEFTVQAFSDGKNIVPMPAVQDHPHAFEGDLGPITGGMGSYSDKNGLLPFLDERNYDFAVSIMEETIKAIKNEVGPYKGILYGQFMLTKDGPKIVEYNARFGDPEAMNVLPLLNTSLVDICEKIVEGNLRNAKFESKATVCKYMVPRGYPESSASKQVIKVDESKINKENALIYYAAVNQENNKIFTSSSRALAILGIGEKIDEAENICENVTKYVKGDLYHRRDIGTKELIEKRIRHMEEINSSRK